MHGGCLLGRFYEDNIPCVKWLQLIVRARKGNVLSFEPAAPDDDVVLKHFETSCRLGSVIGVQYLNMSKELSDFCFISPSHDFAWFLDLVSDIPDNAVIMDEICTAPKSLVDSVALGEITVGITRGASVGPIASTNITSCCPKSSLSNSRSTRNRENYSDHCSRFPVPAY